MVVDVVHGNGIRIAIAPNNVKKKKRKPRNSIASWEGGDKYDLIIIYTSKLLFAG